MTRLLLNLILFQASWAACVVGAGQARPWLGPAVVLAVLVVHFTLHVAKRSRLQELATLGGCAALGYAADTLLTFSGVLAFPGHALEPLPPLWMLALWLAFGTTLGITFRWLHGRLVTAALLGAAAGPPAYFGGAALGAFELPLPALHSALATAVEWVVLMPLLIAIASRPRESVPRLPT